MIRTTPLLLLIALGFAAEPEPITPPPVEDSALIPPPAPVDVAPAPAAEPLPPSAPRARAGGRVARVAAPAPAWDGRLRLGAGWDSNALLDSDPDEAQADTAVYSGEAVLSWRPVADQSDYLKATATLGHEQRPDLESLDTTRLALAMAGASQGESITTGASLSATRFWLEDDAAAAEFRGGFSAGWLRRDSADLLALELAVIHFDTGADRPSGGAGLAELGTADDRSGLLMAPSWRHWWQLGGGNRLEAGARAGLFSARTEVETYQLVQPFVALRLRPDGWEIAGRAAVEARQYAEARVAGEDDETALIGTLAASADRRLAGNLWAGVLGALSARDSSLDGRDYERWQVGARLTWTIAGEE